MFCAVCLSMLQNEQMKGDHHKTRQDLKRAAENGCRICVYQQRRLDAWYREKGVLYADGSKSFVTYKTLPMFVENFLHFHIIFYLSGHPETLGDDQINIFVENGTTPPDGYQQFLAQAHDDLITRPWFVRPVPWEVERPPKNNGDPAAAQIGKSWLAQCRQQHDCGRNPSVMASPWVPRRLIKVGGLDEPLVWVIPRDSCPVGSEYAALSHCWGQSHNFLTLTADNLKRLESGFSLNELPRSFRDAVTTCRRLGISYLWIDSLCIMQSGPGSQEDWQMQSSEMDMVYWNCDLQIAIDHASSPDVGAFVDRDWPEHLQICPIWSRTRPELPRYDEANNPIQESTETLGELQHLLRGTALHGQSGRDQWFRYTVFTQDDFANRVGHSVLATRGWCLQERLLSHRTLHFFGDRMAWECSEMYEDEYPTKVMDRLDRLHAAWGTPLYDIVHERGRLRSFWWVLSLFCERRFTYPGKDKLLAVAAIARIFASYHDDVYCAGHFLSQLPTDLLWRSLSYHQPKVEHGYAPSWSWASNGSRLWHPPDALSRSVKLVAEVTEVSIDLVNPQNPFGQVKTGSTITLNALRVPWVLSHASSSTDDEIKVIGFSDRNELGSTRGSLEAVFGGIELRLTFDSLLDLPAGKGLLRRLEQAVLDRFRKKLDTRDIFTRAEDVILVVIVAADRGYIYDHRHCDGHKILAKQRYVAPGLSDRRWAMAVQGLIVVKSGEGTYKRLGHFEAGPGFCQKRIAMGDSTIGPVVLI